MEHPTEKSRQKYLKGHPNADPSHHTVKDEHSKRVLEVPKGTFKDVGSFHRSVAPPTLQKFLQTSLPPLTRDNQERVLKSIPAKTVKDAFQDLPTEKQKKVLDDAYQYVMGLRAKTRKIQDSGGGKDPILDKAFTQAHTMWSILQSSHSQSKQALRRIANRILRLARPDL